MSNYAEQLHKKLVLHSETDLIDIKDDIDQLVFLAKEAVEEFEKMEERVDDGDDEIIRLENEVERIEYIKKATEDLGLLGELIKDEFFAIMSNQKCNQIRFLQALQSYNQTITNNKFKSAAL